MGPLSTLLGIASFVLSIVGIYLGFRSHVILGIVLIFVPIVPAVFGLTWLLTSGRVDLAAQTVDFVRSLR